MKTTDLLIINAALTGMVPRRHDSPHVPLTPDEIARDARRCRDAGASIVHLHARGPDGHPTCDAAVYREIIVAVRAACPDLIISGSTSGRVHKRFEERASVLGCDPDLASLTLGSMNFPKQASVNPPEMIRRLALAMRAAGVVPELECFEIGMIDLARDYLIPKGILKPPFYMNLLLGSLGTLAANPANLQSMVAALPRGTTWSAAGIGRFQAVANRLGIAAGGHVRVGLEDGLYYDQEKSRLATNGGLVERVAGWAREAGRRPASPAEARAIIGLPARPDRVDVSAVSDAVSSG